MKGTKIYVTRWALTKGVVESKIERVYGKSCFAAGFPHTLLSRRSFAFTPEERDEQVRLLCERRLKSLERSKAAVQKVLDDLPPSAKPKTPAKPKPKL